MRVKEKIAEIEEKKETLEKNGGNCSGSVLDRLGDLANSTTDENTVNNTNSSSAGPMSIADVAKTMQEKESALVAINLELANTENSGKPTTEKVKEKEASREDDGKRPALTPTEKDDAKLKKEEKDEKDKENKKDEKSETKDVQAKVIDNIKLPSGMNVKAVGDKWMLVNPEGKEMDITPEMNKIDKANQDIYAQNKANKSLAEEASVQSSVQGKADELKDSDITNSQKPGIIDKMAVGLRDFKDSVGNAVFDERDAKALAQFALEVSDDKILKELEDKRKRGKEKDVLSAVKDARQGR